MAAKTTTENKAPERFCISLSVCFAAMELDAYRARYLVDCDRPAIVDADGKSFRVYVSHGTLIGRDSVLEIAGGWDRFHFTLEPDPHGMPWQNTWTCWIGTKEEGGGFYFLKKIFCCAAGPMQEVFTSDVHFQNLRRVEDAEISELHRKRSLFNWWSSQGKIAGKSAADLVSLFQPKPEHTAECAPNEKIKFFFDLARHGHKPKGFQGNLSSPTNDSRPAGLPHA